VTTQTLVLYSFKFNQMKNTVLIRFVFSLLTKDVDNLDVKMK